MDVEIDPKPLVRKGNRAVRITAKAKRLWDGFSDDRASGAKDQILRRMEHYLDNDDLMSRAHFRKVLRLKPPVFEFKGDQIRAWGVKYDEGFLVIHVGRKKQNKISKNDIRVIKQRHRELFECLDNKGLFTL